MNSIRKQLSDLIFTKILDALDNLYITATSSVEGYDPSWAIEEESSAMNTALEQFVNAVLDDALHYAPEEIRECLIEQVEQEEDFLLMNTKSVLDSDGFYTDYSWYRTKDGNHVMVFGDRDYYSPEDGNYDFETDSEDEAAEWFDSYIGFSDVDEDDGYFFDER